MKIGRLWQTLVYFDVIPFGNCWQNLFDRQKKEQEKHRQEMNVVLLNDGESNLALEIINTSLGENYQVRVISANPVAAKQELPAEVEIIAAAGTIAETITPQVLAGVTKVILFEGEGIEAQMQKLSQYLRPGEKLLFDFTQPSPAIKETWGAVDDVVMGGISASELKIAAGRAIFSGMVSTENNGGFASVRTRNFSPPWDLSPFEGIQLRVRGDGRRYKFITRCEGKWDGIGYCHSFDTLDNCWMSVNIPFRDLIPVFRAKTVPQSGPFDASKVYSMQLMLSKFEYDGAYNPQFQAGSFALEIESIKAYGSETFPQLIRIGTQRNSSASDR